MGLLKWLWRRGTKQARKPHPTKRLSRFRPRLEVLEDRALPSSGPSFGWAAAIGDPSPLNTSVSNGVATDSAGNVYTTGFFTGEFLPTGATTPLYSTTGGREIFVTKYSPAGVLQWDIGIGGTANQSGLAIAVDSAGHVDVAGAFHGTATFGSTTLTATGSSFNPFVAQLDANSGSVLWATNPFPTSGYLATSVAVDSRGNAYVAGQDYYSNSFAAKVGSNGSSNGIVLWQDQITTPTNGSPADDGVAVSGSNVYFSGGFNSSATFSTASGNHTVSNNSNGGIAAYVLNLTSNNQFVWAHVFQPVAQKHQNPGIVEINSIAADMIAMAMFMPRDPSTAR